MTYWGLVVVAVAIMGCSLALGDCVKALRDIGWILKEIADLLRDGRGEGE